MKINLHGISELSSLSKRPSMESGVPMPASMEIMASQLISIEVSSKTLVVSNFNLVYPMFFNPTGLFSDLTFHATVEQKCDDVADTESLTFEYCTSAPLTTTAPATAAPTTQAPSTPAPIVLGDQKCSHVPLEGQLIHSRIVYHLKIQLLDSGSPKATMASSTCTRLIFPRKSAKELKFTNGALL